MMHEDHEMMSKYFPFQMLSPRASRAMHFPLARGPAWHAGFQQHLGGSSPLIFNGSCNMGKLHRDDKAEQEHKWLSPGNDRAAGELREDSTHGN